MTMVMMAMILNGHCDNDDGDDNGNDGHELKMMKAIMMDNGHDVNDDDNNGDDDSDDHDNGDNHEDNDEGNYNG